MVSTRFVAARMLYQFTAQVLIQTDLDPAILLDLQTGHYFEANASATQVVIGIQCAESTTQLLERLKQHFHAPEAQLATDLEHLLTDWLDRGWITAKTP